MKIVAAEQMGQIDRHCAEVGLPGGVLMENAGKAVAEEVRQILDVIDRQHILILIGLGNSGWDGLVTACYLHDWGARVSLYLLSQRPPDDPNLKLIQGRKITRVEATRDENLSQLDELLPSASAVVDALFGTGKITVADIGIPAYLAETVTAEFITKERAREALPQRSLGANRESFGRVQTASGSINYIGAAYLACSGATRLGAGLVTLAAATSLQLILASRLTEVTSILLPESQLGIISVQAARLIHQQFDHYYVLLLSCGLGQSQSAISFIRATLFRSKSALPYLVLDADALSTLAKIPNWWQKLTNDGILTPHPGEMARLVGVSVDEVQSDRLGITKRIAQEWHKTIVLKGAYTVIAVPEGQVRINLVANPGLVLAGTGDIITGAIVGLVAKGLSLFGAVVTVYIFIVKLVRWLRLGWAMSV